MNVDRIYTVIDGNEHAGTCACCGRAQYTGCGEAMSSETTLATYWYRWTEGHEGRFELAIARHDSAGDPIENGGVAAIAAHIRDESLIYTVLEPSESSWPGFGAYGKVLDRDFVLHQAASLRLFDIVDAISATEERVSSRILTLAQT